MGYSFFTVEKIKSYNAMNGKYRHNYREMEVPNADKEKINENEELIPLNGKSYKEAFDERIKEVGYGKDGKKIRSNAVLGLEVLTTFSREDRENVDLDKWKANNVKWLQETFKKENVLSVMYHADEAGNVHCHAFIVPIDDKGNLNARNWLANRSKLTALQNSYGKLMNQEHNLKRGLPNSKATHKQIKRYYASLNQELSKELPDPEKNETILDYKKRINEIFVNTNLKNMYLEDRINRMELEYNQEILNQKTQMFKEFYEQYENTFENEREIEREFGSVDNCIEQANKIKNIECGIEETDNPEIYKEMLNNLEEIGKNKRKREKEKLEKIFEKENDDYER